MNPQETHRSNPLTYISLFSGIEAASVAWEPLGFKPLAFAEIDPFPSAVLKERYPNVPNLGDVSTIDWSDYHGKADIVVGGSPCQAFSIAGKREGLMDERGQLMLEYVRAVREIKPTYCIWENVPGVLSQDGGRAFATLQGELEDSGYAVAWRVLDAQFTGVAQRRRRVFLVGCADPGRAAAVLFEPDCLCGDHPSSREKRAQLARAARDGARQAGGAQSNGEIGTYSLAANTIGRKPKNGGNGTGYSEELSYTLTTADIHGVCSSAGAGALNPWDNQTARVYHEEGIAPTLTSNAAGGYKGGAVLGPASAYTLKIRSGCEGGGKGALVQEDVSATLATRQDQTLFQPKSQEQCGNHDRECSGFLYHGSADTRSIGHAEEQSPTITAEGKPPAVAFAQNSRDEVRLIGGDGSLTGALTATQWAKQQTYVTQYGEEMAGTLTARHDSSPCADRGQNIVCLSDDNANAACDINLSGALKVGGSAPIVNDGKDPVYCQASGMANAEQMHDRRPTQAACHHKDPSTITKKDADWVVRRLMPIECERLQGFPDDWTRIPWKGKPAEECPDTPRYKALGNSMAVPVMRWLGQRIHLVEPAK